MRRPSIAAERGACDDRHKSPSRPVEGSPRMRALSSNPSGNSRYSPNTRAFIDQRLKTVRRVRVNGRCRSYWSVCRRKPESQQAMARISPAAVHEIKKSPKPLMACPAADYAITDAVLFREDTCAPCVQDTPAANLRGCVVVRPMRRHACFRRRSTLRRPGTLERHSTNRVSTKSPVREVDPRPFPNDSPRR